MRCFTVLTVLFLLLTAGVSASYAQTASGGMAWTAPTTGGTVTGYRVFTSTVPGSYTFGTPAATFAVPGTDASPATITLPANGQTYYLVVCAYGAMGTMGPDGIAGQGARSNEISVTTPNYQVPGAPSNFHVVGTFAWLLDGTLQLSWRLEQRPVE